MAKFLVLTGLDGVGKDTIAEKIAHQHDCVVLKTPTQPFVLARHEIDKLTLAHTEVHFLFYLASVLHASDEARTLIRQGHNVIMVRYLLDTVVYHRALGLDIELTYDTGLYRILRPDLTIMLQVQQDTRLQRLHSRGYSAGDEVIERGKFATKIVHEYERYKAEYSAVTNDNSPEQVASEIIARYLTS